MLRVYDNLSKCCFLRPEALAAENARFMSRVYAWMTGGLLITAYVAYSVSQSENFIQALLQNRAMFWFLIIAQLGSVFILSAMIHKISALAATLLYLTYAALTGTTLSVIFLVYTQASIFNTFLVTAGAFTGLSAIGFVTKKDLGPVGTFCSMGLFGMIGFAVLSFFIPALRSDTLQMAYSLIGVVVFSGLTAYDTQKIKQLNVLGNEGTAEDRKESILGALTLYLDFINLFLSLLRLMGNRRD